MDLRTEEGQKSGRPLWMVPKWNARESGAAVPISLTGPPLLNAQGLMRYFSHFPADEILELDIFCESHTTLSHPNGSGIADCRKKDSIYHGGTVAALTSKNTEREGKEEGPFRLLWSHPRRHLGRQPCSLSV